MLWDCPMPELRESIRIRYNLWKREETKAGRIPQWRNAPDDIKADQKRIAALWFMDHPQTRKEPDASSDLYSI